jgi:hypothetical protein
LLATVEPCAEADRGGTDAGGIDECMPLGGGIEPEASPAS